MFFESRKKAESSDSCPKTLVVHKERCPQNHPCPSVRVCSAGALTQKGYAAPLVDQVKCVQCEECVRYCPKRALEFWAPWCGYCRRISPVLDRLSEKLGTEISIAKINVDDEPELEDRFDVSVIPTLYLFRKGIHGEKLVAPNSQAQIEEWIAAQLTS
jgi:thioredoxin 1